MQQISKSGVENTTIRLYRTVDTVIGKKGKDNCILSITERKTRMQFMVLLDLKTADSVEYRLKSIFSKYGIDIFKSITSDNGLEFSTLADVVKNICEVYFAHPYSVWERGSNENNNRMIRRYIPKGRCIDDYSREQIALIEDSINNLPRKILRYLSAKEAFEIELEKITKIKKVRTLFFRFLFFLSD